MDFNYLQELRRRLANQPPDRWVRLRKFLDETKAKQDLRRRHRLNAKAWIVIQEHFGPAEDWPSLIRRKFWCSNLEYKDRAWFAALAVGNGCNIELMCDVLRECNSYATQIRLNKIKVVYDWLNLASYEGIRRRSNYFYYDFWSRRVLNCNGDRRDNQAAAIEHYDDVTPRREPRGQSRGEPQGYHC